MYYIDIFMYVLWIIWQFNFTTQKKQIYSEDVYFLRVHTQFT